MTHAGWTTRRIAAKATAVVRDGGGRRQRRGVPRRAGHVARGRVQLRGQSHGPRPVRLATRLGPRSAGGSCERTGARTSTRSRSSSGRETHDPLWNAAQRQLVREGRIHNYLRMLWGKKILEWTPNPRDAVAVHGRAEQPVRARRPRPELVQRDLLDARALRPSLGAATRPVFGVIRYMSSANTAKKLRLARYLETYGAQGRLIGT